MLTSLKVLWIPNDEDDDVLKLKFSDIEHLWKEQSVNLLKFFNRRTRSGNERGSTTHTFQH